MPIYEYQCKQCKVTFERVVFKGEEALVRCPDCGNKEVKKLMSAASFMGKSMGTCASDSPREFS